LQHHVLEDVGTNSLYSPPIGVCTQVTYVPEKEVNVGGRDVGLREKQQTRVLSLHFSHAFSGSMQQRERGTQGGAVLCIYAGATSPFLAFHRFARFIDNSSGLILTIQ
jgi:hypothetical protein